MRPLAWLAACLLPLSGCSSEAVPDYGFVAHLEEAIALNTQRQPLYGEMTDYASGELSQLLIGTEQIALSMAEGLDERAEPFQEEGIPIVAADFVSMKDVAPYDRPPTYPGNWSTDAEDALAAAVEPLTAVDPGEFETVCARASEVLEEIEALEHQHDTHMAMTRHVVESTGFAALHAIDYAEQSDGRTVELSRDLVAAQVDPLHWGLNLGFDRRAAAIHALGAGIIFNDVPPIPFESEYEDWLQE